MSKILEFKYKFTENIVLKYSTTINPNPENPRVFCDKEFKKDDEICLYGYPDEDVGYAGIYGSPGSGGFLYSGNGKYKDKETALCDGELTNGNYICDVPMCILERVSKTVVKEN